MNGQVQVSADLPMSKKHAYGDVITIKSIIVPGTPQLRLTPPAKSRRQFRSLVSLFDPHILTSGRDLNCPQWLLV